MPKKTWPIWLLTVTALIGYPVVTFFYVVNLSRTGALPVNGDSLGLPILGNLLVALIASPFVLGVTYLCLRRYNATTSLLAWRRDRLVRSIVSTATFGAGAGLLLLGALEAMFLPEFWFDRLWAGYFLLLMLWFLCMRAALIDQRNANTKSR